MPEGSKPMTNLLFPDAKQNNFKLTIANTLDLYAQSLALPNKTMSDTFILFARQFLAG